MASIFRRVRGGAWFIEYNDTAGKRVRVKGFRDKKLTEARARELEAAVERRAAGLPCGDAERTLDSARTAYLADMNRVGKSEPYRRNVEGFLIRAENATSWRTLRDVRPDTFGAWLGTLATAGRSPCTVNAYRDAWVTFLAWCVRQGWLTENPLASVAKSRVTVRPRKRRAFTVEEFRALCTAAPRRARLYRLAAYSGLRRNELRHLEERDYTLAPRPLWRLRAEITKSKRAEVVPMLPQAAAVLTGGVPRMCMRRAFNRDLARAGVERVTEAGQVDFHSFRYTFASWLGRRLPIQTVRRLMRHRDIRTTVNLYMQLGIEDIAEDVMNLPVLEGLAC